jgi:hypothetical protein
MTRGRTPKLHQCGWCYRTALFVFTGSQPGQRVTLYACQNHRNRAWRKVREMLRYSTRKLPDRDTLF